MLTQRPPFDADTPLAVLLRHVNDPLPLPGDVVIPQPLERVLLKALAKQPEARYQSAAEMAEALRRAAQELELPLPEQLPPPLTFTTVEAPTEDVAIYSGAARAQVTDTGFADDDTNVTAVPSKALELVRPAATTPRETFALRLRGNTFRLPVKGETGTIIAASTFAPAWNLLGIMAAGITTRPLFTYGWPAELFLVSLILSAVMWTAQSIWLLIPTLLVLGNGMLFSYYTLTGNWEQWAFLWPLELFIAGGAICAPFILARLRGVNRENTGLLGFNLGVLSLAAVLFISVAALVKW